MKIRNHISEKAISGYDLKAAVIDIVVRIVVRLYIHAGQLVLHASFLVWKCGYISTVAHAAAAGVKSSMRDDNDLQNCQVTHMLSQFSPLGMIFLPEPEGERK